MRAWMSLASHVGARPPLPHRARTSAGGRIEPMDHYDEGLVGSASDAMWKSLPALRSLTVEGALLFHGIAGDALTDLRLRGATISDGSAFPGSGPDLVTLPNLTTLELDTRSDDSTSAPWTSQAMKSTATP